MGYARQSGLLLLISMLCAAVSAADDPSLGGGELRILDSEGQHAGVCPLEHTSVEATITGFVSRVTVEQIFHNPTEQKIEAVYIFPLPSEAAVDDMTMLVGERRIRGRIKERGEAKRIYEAARQAGHVASLLQQERPNIFTQSVANIEPGARVRIQISYTHTLAFEDGQYTFTFPMVIGPRYMPGSPNGHQGTGWAPDTDRVPDASRISPPVAGEGERAGHDIDLTLRLDAGLEIREINSRLHEVDIERIGPSRAVVRLADRATIPNRDFILSYRTSTDDITETMLIHPAGEKGAYFTLILQPPRRVAPAQAVPKELIFVIDRSGSMRGFPIEKAKATMRMAIKGMNPDDRFNLLSFAGGTGRCFERPMPNTRENREHALHYLADLYGSGGTEMLPAIREALSVEASPASDRPIRIVCFMTDGFIGNDYVIIDAIKKHVATSRVFSFGIGNSVNRFLIEGMAAAGRGEAEIVTLAAHGGAAAQRFHERIRTPVLTDISLDWGDLPVRDRYPRHLPDLFSAQPIMIHGRLDVPTRRSATAIIPKATITLRGRTAQGAYERKIDVQQLASQVVNPALPSLWARARVADLLLRDYPALQRNQFPEHLKQQVIDLALDYRLMTPFTSFVAVEELTVTAGGQPTTITVPVEMPEGVDHEGIFGRRRARGVGKGSTLGQSYFAAPSASHIGGGAVLEKSADMLSTTNPDVRDGPSAHPASRLAPSLQDLAEKVRQQGRNGNLELPPIEVSDWRVDVRVYLADVSESTLAALERLGFETTGQAASIHLVTGSIDVRKLQALAELDTVQRIEPLQG